MNLILIVHLKAGAMCRRIKAMYKLKKSTYVTTAEKLLYLSIAELGNIWLLLVYLKNGVNLGGNIYVLGVQKCMSVLRMK